jgi:hypothetical protein
VSGDIAANQVVDLVFDGTSFRDITGTTTNTAVGALTAQSGEGIYVDGTAHVNLNYPGLSTQTPQGPDLFSFYSQNDTHHRVITYANLLSQISTSNGLFKGIAVITTTSTWVKPSGVNSVIAFVTGPGGAGGGASGVGSGGWGAGSFPNCQGAGGGAGGTSISWINLSGVASVPCTVGTGGTAVTAASGNPGNGTTAFGSYLYGSPGGGGQGPDISDPEKWGGVAGVGSGGLMNMPGNGGQPAPSASDTAGAGGSSFWSGGGRGASPAAFVGPGEPGVYGSGGGGGDNDVRGSSVAGGKGGDGVIVLFMYS